MCGAESVSFLLLEIGADAAHEEREMGQIRSCHKFTEWHNLRHGELLLKAAIYGVAAFASAGLGYWVDGLGMAAAFGVATTVLLYIVLAD
jgi:hypothetical protein